MEFAAAAPTSTFGNDTSLFLLSNSLLDITFLLLDKCD